MARFRYVLTPALLGALALPAVFAASAADREIALRYGRSDSDYERIGLGVRLAPVWTAERGNWQAQLRPEFELSHFGYSGPAPDPDSVWQGGAIAHVRAVRGGTGLRPYGEAGLGAAVFSNDRLGTKRFSTHFQFSQHLGVGVEFRKRAFAGYQYSHYSNADIDEPDDGVDLHQLVLGRRF